MKTLSNYTLLRWKYNNDFINVSNKKLAEGIPHC